MNPLTHLLIAGTMEALLADRVNVIRTMQEEHAEFLFDSYTKEELTEAAATGKLWTGPADDATDERIQQYLFGRWDDDELGDLWADLTGGELEPTPRGLWSHVYGPRYDEVCSR